MATRFFHYYLTWTGEKYNNFEVKNLKLFCISILKNILILHEKFVKIDFERKLIDDERDTFIKNLKEAVEEQNNFKDKT